MEHLSNTEWSTTHLEVVQIMGVIQDKLNGSPVEIIQALNRVYESAVKEKWKYVHDKESIFNNDGTWQIEIKRKSFINRVQKEIDGAKAKQATLIDVESPTTYQ